MPYTQDNRSIAIATPLGKDKLLLRALTINEQLGRPFRHARLICSVKSLTWIS
jgi:hypothetical protein